MVDKISLCDDGVLRVDDGYARRDAIRAAAQRPRPAKHKIVDAAGASQSSGGEREVQAEPTVFISYARHDIETVRCLVDRCRSAGIKVTWDQDFAGGEDFVSAIKKAIDAARCVIVVWSAKSVLSRYVCDEAARALHQNKLITTHLPDFDFQDVPIGFGRLNAVPIDDEGRVRISLAHHGVKFRV